MADVRARYRHREAWLIFPVLVVASVALPVFAVFVEAASWWLEALFLVVAIPMLWWWMSVRLVHRMELTDTELRLRSLLGAWRVPLDELVEIGAPSGDNVVRVVRRDGRTWTVLSSDGIVDFADAVGRAAPQAEVRVSGWTRRMARWNSRRT